jgi:hypothetical protein
MHYSCTIYSFVQEMPCSRMNLCWKRMKASH